MRFYLDSMVWIYALEGHAQFGNLSASMLREMRAGHHTVLTSSFLLAELLVAPTTRNDLFLAASYKQTHTSPPFVAIPFTTEVAVRFATLRSQLRIKTPDAIHLALASAAKTDVFVTADRALQRAQVQGIGRVVGLDYRVPSSPTA